MKVLLLQQTPRLNDALVYFLSIIFHNQTLLSLFLIKFLLFLK